ncbi:hypothetical protein Pcinc_023943 [Petrolisthes cinctipes]|uniref:Calponin-homology (CH) domain-containing protein n=1 Tax=Petrolisthes cinctipes TaxID=88211 RepID=A0AAE1FDZ8_PETCI|nr:hypothetical protein Pcinc_023943 [Petrolisthes cinctipes]
MHYQIGQSKFPPKKIMLSWLKAEVITLLFSLLMYQAEVITLLFSLFLFQAEVITLHFSLLMYQAEVITLLFSLLVFQAVLPDCRVVNFTSDWNSGVYLSALLDYCKPGLFTNWKTLNPHNKVDNCKNAMEIAKAEFNIPMVLDPDILASPYLDDLSGMTYLSYFMKEGGPGYKATLKWLQNQLPDRNIKNFTTDWNDGRNLTSLVKQLGGPIPGYKKLNTHPSNWESNLKLGLDGGRKLGVEPVLAAGDMARPDVEYLANMGYLAYYQWIRPRECPADTIAVKCEVDNVRVNNPVPFKIEFLTKEVVVSELEVFVNGPSGPVRIDLDISPRGGKGLFVPEEVGIYEVTVVNEGEVVDGCPLRVRALPDVSKIMFSGIDPCALGSIVEVVINSNGAGGGGIDVTAYSPTNRPLLCPVKVEDGVYAATFQPDEAGEWSIAVRYDDEHIQGSPFTCHVYDPHALKLRELDRGPDSSPGKPFTFVVDATMCGWGEAKVDVTQGSRSIPSKSLEIDRGVYEITFTPTEAARHKIYAYFNGHEVKGSPFSLYLGIEKPPERKDSKSKKKKSSNRENKDPKQVKEIVKEYSGSALVNSPKLSSNTNSAHRSTLTKTYDSTIDKNYNSIHNKSYESTYDRTLDSSRDTDYENVMHRARESPVGKYDSLVSKSHDSSVSKNNSSYDAIKNKYVNFESSSVVNRSTVYDSKKVNSSYESTPPKIYNDASPKKLSSYGSSPRSPTRLESRRSRSPDTHNTSYGRSSALDSTHNSSYNRSSALDSSHNSSFNTNYSSSFNTSSSTVINTGTSTTNQSSSSIFRKSPSPARLSSPSPRKSASPSPPPPRGFRAVSPLDRATSPRDVTRSSPVRAISPAAGPPDNLTGLSSPAKVLQIAQNAVKTSEARRLRNLPSSGQLRSRTLITTRDESSDAGGSHEESPVRLRFSEQKSAHYGSDEHLASSSHNLASTTTTTIRRTEEKLTSSADRHVITQSGHGMVLGLPPDGRKGTRELLSPSPTPPITHAPSSPNPARDHHHRQRNHTTESTTYLSSSSTSVDVPDAVSHRLQSASPSYHHRSVNNTSPHHHTSLHHTSADSSALHHTSIDLSSSSHHHHTSVDTSIDHSLHHDPSLHHTSSIDPTRVSVSGPGVRLVSVSSPAEFTVSTPQPLRQEEVNVRITGPGKRVVPVSTDETSGGEVVAAFKPLEVGEYVVDVRVGSVRVPGSPFRCYVYNSQEIQVGSIPDGIVGRPVEFEIDGSSAGSGNLEILVNGGHVTSYVRNLGGQRFLASFVPHSAIRHVVEMRFNGEKVPGECYCLFK